MQTLNLVDVAVQWKEYATLKNGKLEVDWNAVANCSENARARKARKENFLRDLKSCGFLKCPVEKGDYIVSVNGLIEQTFINSPIGFQDLDEAIKYARAFYGDTRFPIEVYQKAEGVRNAR